MKNSDLQINIANDLAQSKESAKKNLWEELRNVSVETALSSFLSTLRPHTKRTYVSAFKRSFEIWTKANLINPDTSLYSLAHCNMENLLDALRMYLHGSESTKQNRCAAFISFTKYLHRITGRLIPVAIPNKGANATFIKIREKAHTQALTHEEWIKFSASLKKRSFRDYLIAKAMLQGAKRCSEVLGSRIEHIDWEQNRIFYRQLKTNVFEKKTVISYSLEFMNELKSYLGDRREGLIFLTNQGSPVTQPHLHRSFNKASVIAGLKHKVHPHMLRTTAITLFMKMGYHSDQIMRVSGHSNTASVIYYDKTPDEENLTIQTKII